MTRNSRATTGFETEAKAYLQGFQDCAGMAQIRVSEETYARLVRVKAKLEEVTGRPVSFCDALVYLCDLFQQTWRDDVILPQTGPRRRQ